MPNVGLFSPARVVSVPISSANSSVTVSSHRGSVMATVAMFQNSSSSSTSVSSSATPSKPPLPSSTARHSIFQSPAATVATTNATTTPLPRRQFDDFGSPTLRAAAHAMGGSMPYICVETEDSPQSGLAHSKTTFTPMPADSSPQVGHLAQTHSISSSSEAESDMDGEQTNVLHHDHRKSVTALKALFSSPEPRPGPSRGKFESPMSSSSSSDIISTPQPISRGMNSVSTASPAARVAVRNLIASKAAAHSEKKPSKPSS
jgi:hypothetical protein